MRKGSTSRKTSQVQRSAPLIASLFGLLACAADEQGPEYRTPQGGAAGRDGMFENPIVEPGMAGRPAMTGTGGSGGTGGVAGSGGSDTACARESREAMKDDVYLLFAFDVSGSMGKMDKAWHDRALKWEPVVAATRAFFEGAESEGMSASMTFFPAEEDRCESDSYQEPDVAMSPLPSDAFGEAMDAIGAEDWRGGTPTLHVLQGLFGQIDGMREQMPGSYVVVLVTDGYPQDCDDDSIESVASLVAEHAEAVSTYVIGVENPPVEDAPDTTTNLAQIAEAGGTEQAYLIDTGDPQRTIARFSEAIDAIRGLSFVPCELPIPAPPDGRTFDKTRVSVSLQAASGTTQLEYSGDCSEPLGWRYDDEGAPTEIALCPAACEQLEAAADPKLDVAFECEQVIVL